MQVCLDSYCSPAPHVGNCAPLNYSFRSLLARRPIEVLRVQCALVDISTASKQPSQAKESQGCRLLGILCYRVLKFILSLPDKQFLSFFLHQPNHFSLFRGICFGYIPDLFYSKVLTCYYRVLKHTKKSASNLRKINEAVFLVLSIKNVVERVRILVSLLILKLFIDTKAIFFS